jgi:hypothetical protein
MVLKRTSWMTDQPGEIAPERIEQLRQPRGADPERDARFDAALKRVIGEDAELLRRLA